MVKQWYESNRLSQNAKSLKSYAPQAKSNAEQPKWWNIFWIFKIDWCLGVPFFDRSFSTKIHYITDGC